MLFVHVAHPGHIVGVLVPELPAAYSHALSLVLAKHALDQELVALVLVEVPHGLLAGIGDLLG